MACQLPTDCLNEIFEYLEKDKISLHSCLLVNRLWCEVAVRILWRDVWDFQYDTYYPHGLYTSTPSVVLNTLVACLSNESKGLLHTNGIFIQTSLKPPLFNYISFIKVLPIDKIHKTIIANQ